MHSLRHTLATVPAAGRCAVAILSAAAMISAMPVTARSGTIFETESGPGTVGEYTTSGATVNASLITHLPAPVAIAVSGADLFVGNADSGTIGEYTTSGATVNASLITGLGPGNPFGIAVSGSNLFAASRSKSNPITSMIGEYTTSGATVNATLITGLIQPLGIAVSGSDLFVANADSGTIGEYTTSGATVNASLITGLNGPFGIAVSGSDLFVSVCGHDCVSNSPTGTGTIGEYTTSGATVNASLIAGLTIPHGIAVSGSDLFVSVCGHDCASGSPTGTGTIGEYTTSGATVNASLITGLSLPTGIAVVVPEPATGLLVMVGALGLAVAREHKP